MAKEVVQGGTEINAAKLKALQATIDKIEKDYGKGTIMKLGDQPKWEVSVIPSGSIALDAALGVGGYPRGRVIEIYGPESSGKTTLAIHAIAQNIPVAVLKSGSRDAASSIRVSHSKALTRVSISQSILCPPYYHHSPLSVKHKVRHEQFFT